MKYYKTRQETKLERQQRQKLHSIFSGYELDIIIIALTWMENEINKFPDKQAEFGPDLTIKVKDIEPIKEFIRYG